MSSLARDLYSLDHPVFSGGRYLKAFDHLPDIDSSEHHILVYLGSFMPFNQGFIDHAAYPSVPTIARSTRMSESTVRKKIRSLEKKGHIRVKSLHYLNRQGKWQQSSNRYYLTPEPFTFFEGVLETQKHIENILKTTIDEPTACQFHRQAECTPPPADITPGSLQDESPPQLISVANSLSDIPKPPENLPSSCVRNLATVTAEVDNIADGWKEVVGLPVTHDEKKRFLLEYIATRGNELLYLERIKEICECVYLQSRAKSINFLFTGLDMAKRNRAEIRHVAMRALNSVDTESQFSQVIAQLPELIAAKSRHFAEPSITLVNSMLQDLFESARKRLHLPAKRRLPANDVELRKEIDRLLNSCGSDHIKDRLETIKLSISKMNFSRSLELFAKYALSHEASNAND